MPEVTDAEELPAGGAKRVFRARDGRPVRSDLVASGFRLVNDGVLDGGKVKCILILDEVDDARIRAFIEG